MTGGVTLGRGVSVQASTFAHLGCLHTNEGQSTYASYPSQHLGGQLFQTLAKTRPASCQPSDTTSVYQNDYLHFLQIHLIFHRQQLESCVLPGENFPAKTRCPRKSTDVWCIHVYIRKRKLPNLFCQVCLINVTTNIKVSNQILFD